MGAGVGAGRPNGSGFDAVIGNPPFLGGQKLTGSLGTAYREYLAEWIGHGAHGSADLVACFLLRAHAVLNQGGQTGLPEDAAAALAGPDEDFADATWTEEGTGHGRRERRSIRTAPADGITWPH